jgi:glycosyltransferase involved in cell wall biosynthesis
MRRPGVLWLVQDGVLAGPGASQTIPYVAGLAAAGFRIALLSVEKARFLHDRDRVRRTRESLRRAGVPWTTLPFGSGPAAPRTLLQIARLAIAGRGLVLRRKPDLVHARSYLPALTGLLLSRPILFDMRGLWPRERVDGGIWREGSLAHRAGERLERILLRRARAVVVLARGALGQLPDLEKPVRVIPTAVDLERFRPGLPPPPGSERLTGSEVFAIAGALGSWYLLDEMLDLVAAAVRRRDTARVLLLTEEDPRRALEGLDARGVPRSRIEVRGVPHREVPAWISLASAGVLLIRTAPSKRASAPTKLGELLACGVPVLISPGIGDTEELVTESRTGIVVRDVSPRGIAGALAELDRLRAEGEVLVRRCRETAERHLSLAAAVRGYAKLYEDIIRGPLPCDRP